MERYIRETEEELEALRQVLAEKDKRIRELCELVEATPAVPQYTHRNGETEPPTESGWYWYTAGENPKHGNTGVVYVANVNGSPVIWREDFWLSDEGQWWGPITPPWATQPTE